MADPVVLPNKSKLDLERLVFDTDTNGNVVFRVKVTGGGIGGGSTSVPIGPTTMANSVPVTIATDQTANTFYPAVQPVSLTDGADATQGTTTDAAWNGVAAGATVVAVLKAIWTRLASVAITAVTPTNSTSVAYETNRLAKASAGTLFGLTGYNSNVAAQFIQVHDALSLPADTAVPKVLIKVNGASAFAIDFGLRGRAFATGIVACNSSTGPTKTIGAADCWFDVQYS